MTESNDAKTQNVGNAIQEFNVENPTMHNYAIKMQATLSMHISVDLPPLAFDTGISSQVLALYGITSAITLTEPTSSFLQHALQKSLGGSDHARKVKMERDYQSGGYGGGYDGTQRRTYGRS